MVDFSQFVWVRNSERSYLGDSGLGSFMKLLSRSHPGLPTSEGLIGAGGCASEVTHSHDCQVGIGSWWGVSFLVQTACFTGCMNVFMTWWLTSSGVHDQRDKSKSSDILWLIFKEFLPIPSVNSIGPIDQTDKMEKGPWIPGGKYLWGCLWGWLLQPQLMTAD